jgi:hypothetical protein
LGPTHATFQGGPVGLFLDAGPDHIPRPRTGWSWSNTLGDGALGIAVALGASPASAAPTHQPSYNSSCVAQLAVFFNSLDPGFGGRITSINVRYFGGPQSCVFL